MNLQTFDFNDSAVRVMMRAEQPWFVAADVCRVLDIQNPTDAVKGLDEDETITLANSEGNPRAGIPHSLRLISESGLYALVFKSRKLEAKVFRKWVTSEVLPALRKTGKYEVAPVVPMVRDQMMVLRCLLLDSALAVKMKVLDVARAQQVANLSARYLESIKMEGEAIGYEAVFEMRAVEAGGGLLQAGGGLSADAVQGVPQPSVQGAQAARSGLPSAAVSGEEALGAGEPAASFGASGEDFVQPGGSKSGPRSGGGAAGAAGGDS